MSSEPDYHYNTFGEKGATGPDEPLRGPRTMSIERRRVDAYLDTIARFEPEIAQVDIGAAAASIAISLKRLADAFEKILQMEVNAAQAQGEHDADTEEFRRKEAQDGNG